MIIEILYQGEVLHQIDLPEVRNMKCLEFGVRMSSSMNEKKGKQDFELRPIVQRLPMEWNSRQIPHNKSNLHDIPKGLHNNPNFLKSRAEKGEVRPKAEYSNPEF